MDTAPSYQPYLDQLVAFATAEPRKPDLIAAKAQYFERTGEIFEDDKSFEMRMAGFLDFYLFDRPVPETGKTPAQEFYAHVLETHPEQASVLRCFTHTIHGLFELRKIGKGILRLRDLYSGEDYEVTERRQMVGLAKGDVIEARLIPFEGHLLFSGAFVCHPKDAFDAIRKEVKRRKKREPQRTAKELTWECSKMALKVDRYRQISVEKIYDFENRTI